MKRIEQKHKLGCGIAAFAMFANIDYESSLKIVHPKKKPTSRVSVTVENIDKALNRTNINCDKIYYPKIKQLDKDALLFCKNLKNKYFHCVVWDSAKKTILDPCPFRKQSKELSHYQKRAVLAFVIK
ncbi:MAG: hypothetical protein LC122_14185 [Chitinophagales bacterium]|nr:hypothetical protein [Chitinophagales bacterium]